MGCDCQLIIKDNDDADDAKSQFSAVSITRRRGT